MFALIVLDAQKKFLSRRTCATVHDATLHVNSLLQRDVVGQVTVVRIVPKPSSPPQAPRL